MPRPKKKVMQWKRKQLRGISAKKRKEWYTTDKRYRIIWNAEYAGIDLTKYYGSLFHASVYTSLGWSRITGQVKFYRTLKAAQRACEAHKKNSEGRK